MKCSIAETHVLRGRAHEKNEPWVQSPGFNLQHPLRRKTNQLPAGENLRRDRETSMEVAGVKSRSWRVKQGLGFWLPLASCGFLPRQMETCLFSSTQSSGVVGTHRKEEG